MPHDSVDVYRDEDFISPTEVMLAEAPIFEDEPTLGMYVYICEFCGQPLPFGHRCNSGLHVGPKGGPKGKAVRSNDLVFFLRNRIIECQRECEEAREVNRHLDSLNVQLVREREEADRRNAELAEGIADIAWMAYDEDVERGDLQRAIRALVALSSPSTPKEQK